MFHVHRHHFSIQILYSSLLSGSEWRACAECRQAGGRGGEDRRAEFGARGARRAARRVRVAFRRAEWQRRTRAVQTVAESGAHAIRLVGAHAVARGRRRRSVREVNAAVDAKTVSAQRACACCARAVTALLECAEGPVERRVQWGSGEPIEGAGAGTSEWPTVEPGVVRAAEASVDGGERACEHSLGHWAQDRLHRTLQVQLAELQARLHLRARQHLVHELLARLGLAARLRAAHTRDTSHPISLLKWVIRTSQIQ